MAIDPKKYTRAELAKMVEEAQEKNAALEAEIVELHEHLAISNKAAIVESEEYRENTAKLKADVDVLRGKLADTEAALGRANAEASFYKSESRAARKEATDAQWAQIVEYRRAKYAEAHPWRNLWAWVKRNLGCAE